MATDETQANTRRYEYNLFGSLFVVYCVSSVANKAFSDKPRHGWNTDGTRIREEVPGSELMELLHKDITEQIIGGAFEVYGILGYGLSRKCLSAGGLQVELISRGRCVKLKRASRCSTRITTLVFMKRTYS